MTRSAFGGEGGTTRTALALALPVAGALLQGTLAPLIAIGGIRPSVPVLIAGSWSVATGAGEGIWWAFVAGIATDLLSGGPLGAYTVALLPAVALIGVGERPIVRPIPVLSGASLVALAAFASALLYAGILAFLGRPLDPLPILIAQVFAAAIYTGVLALGVYPLARVLRRRTGSESPF